MLTFLKFEDDLGRDNFEDFFLLKKCDTEAIIFEMRKEGRRCLSSPFEVEQNFLERKRKKKERMMMRGDLS